MPFCLGEDLQREKEIQLITLIYQKGLQDFSIAEKSAFYGSAAASWSYNELNLLFMELQPVTMEIIMLQ